MAVATVLLAAGCVGGQARPRVDTVAAQEAACAAAIAAHVGKPASAVRARWLSIADGIATVEVVDGGRRHLCMVDSAARVRTWSHPGA